MDRTTWRTTFSRKDVQPALERKVRRSVDQIPSASGCSIGAPVLNALLTPQVVPHNKQTAASASKALGRVCCEEGIL